MQTEHFSDFEILYSYSSVAWHVLEACVSLAGCIFS